MNKLPALFISHGGGPWPWIPEMRKDFAITESELKLLGKKFKPSAILSISGHWETSEFAVATSSLPKMIYDYRGFPEHTYKIKYDAPGAPDVALRVKQLLNERNVTVNEDPQQGFDHGTFVPLYLMYPEADIPVAQLSIKNNLDPREHIEIGKMLEPLRSENILIIGSGLSYHNLRSFFSGGGGPSRIFEEWLTTSVESEPSRRNEMLIEWEKAPAARASHPREDHLIPLMVVAGAAGNDKGKRIILDQAFNVSMSSYQFGE